MTEPVATTVVAFKYRAFLSYSHRDMRWAKWLHDSLEAFRIDDDLAGRQTPLGAVPKSLRPIFRDREDFSGGHTLKDATIEAIDGSAALLVLCSTVAAMRPAVNEEVRLFRSRHPDRPVIPVIVDGSYPDNFPPALRFDIAPDGTITDRPVTILGPDLRESGDGKTLGLAKAVAGMIGVGSDDIFRRAERTRRRQARMRNAVAGVMLMLTASGGFFAWRTHVTQQVVLEQKSTLDDIQALVAKYSPITSAQASPGAHAGLTAAITAIANGAATDARYAQALALLKEGKPAEAEPLLKSVADDMATRARSDAKKTAEAYRNLGTIAGLADPTRARDYYSKALEFDPDNTDSLMWTAWLEKEAGHLVIAEKYYRHLVELKANAPESSEAFWGQLGLGDIRVARGDLPGALADHRKALTIAQRISTANPTNGDWQHNLMSVYTKIGDVLTPLGELDDALKANRDGLAVIEKLANSEPNNTTWQRDIYICLWRVGDVLIAQGKHADALVALRRGREIMARLSATEPKNINWQRDIMTADILIGDVLTAQTQLQDALKSYTDGLSIIERVSLTDDNNSGWKRDIYSILWRVSDVQIQLGNLDPALTTLRRGQDIMEHLTQQDPNNTGWQRDLMTVYNKLGDVLEKKDQPDEALRIVRQGLAIAERLSKSDPANALWRWDVVTAQWRLANHKDDPARRWQFIVDEMLALKRENKLRPDWERYLPSAQEQLAYYKKQPR